VGRVVSATSDPNGADGGTDGGADLEWATRLAVEVQRLGLSTADAVVSRFVRLVGDFGADRVDRGGSETDGSGRVRMVADDSAYRRLQADLERALEGYLRLLRELHETALPLLGRTDDGSATDGSGRLELPQVRPGGSSSGRVWLHNTSAAEAHALRPWTPGLCTHSGAAIEPGHVTFDPPLVPTLPIDESAALLVMVSAPPDAAPGVYHGVLLVENLPEQSMPLAVEVVAQVAPR
jgi:hypothetical protein